MSKNYNCGDEFPMYGTFDNLYAGLDDHNPTHGFIKWSNIERFWKKLKGDVWVVRGLTLYNKYLDKIDDFTDVCEKTRHPCGFLMWDLEKLAKKRNIYKKYYWAGWHTQN